jgi:hypothetical protein
MTSVLYYSNYCPHSKQLLIRLSKSAQSKKMHFICIDNREIQKDGGTHIILDNGQRVLLPPNITSVPSLLLLHHGNRAINGIKEITHHLNPGEIKINNDATKMNGEPLAFSFCEMGSNLSDNYSYLDLTSDQLSAKGDGGLRMLHNYVTINDNLTIATPPEDYVPNKIGTIDMGKLQQSRALEIKQD